MLYGLFKTKREMEWFIFKNALKDLRLNAIFLVIITSYAALWLYKYSKTEFDIFQTVFTTGLCITALGTLPFNYVYYTKVYRKRWVDSFVRHQLQKKYSHYYRRFIN